MKSQPRLVRLYFFSTAALLLILMTIFGLFWGVHEYRNLQVESRRIAEERLKSGRELIHRQVLRTFSFLEHKQSLTNQRIETNLRERVYAAHAVAARLYQLYGKTLPPPDLNNLIVETLRPMRFNQGRSRFFIIDYSGAKRLEDEHAPWADHTHLSEIRYHLVIKDMIRIARTQGESFYAYNTKNNAMDGAPRRIVFLKRFEPLRCIIGSEEDPEVVEFELKKEALAQLQEIRYDDEGYIFVIRSDGVMLSHPDMRLIGKNLLQNPDARVRGTIARLIQAGKQTEGGESRYLWPKPSGDRPVPKLSYTRTFAPWGWIVGTGVYLDDIDKEIAAATADYRKTLFDEFVSGGLLFSGFVLFSLVMYRFMAGRMEGELRSLTEFFKRAAVSHQKIDPKSMKFREFATLGDSANRLVDDFLGIQKQLQFRIDFENLVMDISTRFIKVTPEKLDHEIDQVLADIGTITQMARCYLFQFIKGDSRMDKTHEWCADGIESQRNRLQGLAVADFPTVKNYILKGRDAHIPDIADLPDVNERRKFEYENTRSLLLIPTLVAGKVTGFLGFDSIRPIPLWSDEIVGLLRIAGEIIAGGLERRSAEVRIKEIEQIIESTPAVVFRWKNAPGWPVEVVTKNVENLFGFTAEEFTSGRVVYDSLIHPEDRERVAREINYYSRGLAEAFAQEYRIIAADGSVRWIDDRTYIRKDTHGDISHYQGVVIDISELKQLEYRHQELEKQYQQAQKMEALGRLSGGVAHDFNNLLTVILGYTEILLKKADEEHPHQEGLVEIQKAALMARDLIGHLLIFSRKQPMQMSATDIGEVVPLSGKMLSRIIGEDIELQVATSSEALPVMADITQIEQVLMNLAVNARDAMPDGGILTIETARVHLDESYVARKAGVVSGDYAMIGVSDNGSGMDETTRLHIFEPFFTTKDAGKGTGLGLATCYGIIKQHGGHIFCYSEPGRGTSFKIYLPIVQDEPSEVSPETEAEATMTSWAATVLVIEDDPAVLDLTCGILSEIGYSVLKADHPKEALRIAETTVDPIDLVVTDVVMPGMKGPEAYTKILEHHPEAGALFMSGYTENAVIAQEIGLKGHLYIQKPFSTRLLLERVAAALRDKSSGIKS